MLRSEATSTAAAQVQSTPFAVEMARKLGLEVQVRAYRDPSTGCRSDANVSARRALTPWSSPSDRWQRATSWWWWAQAVRGSC